MDAQESAHDVAIFVRLSARSGAEEDDPLRFIGEQATASASRYGSGRSTFFIASPESAGRRLPVGPPAAPS